MKFILWKFYRWFITPPVVVQFWREVIVTGFAFHSYPVMCSWLSLFFFVLVLVPLKVIICSQSLAGIPGYLLIPDRSDPSWEQAQIQLFLGSCLGPYAICVWGKDPTGSLPLSIWLMATSGTKWGENEQSRLLEVSWNNLRCWVDFDDSLLFGRGGALKEYRNLSLLHFYIAIFCFTLLYKCIEIQNMWSRHKKEKIF